MNQKRIIPLNILDLNNEKPSNLLLFNKFLAEICRICRIFEVIFMKKEINWSLNLVRISFSLEFLEWFLDSMQFNGKVLAKKGFILSKMNLKKVVYLFFHGILRWCPWNFWKNSWHWWNCFGKLWIFLRI